MATASQFRARNRRRSGQEGDAPAFFDDILSLVGGLANSRKQYAASHLESLSNSVRQFAEDMPDIPTVRDYATTAAESLEQLADYVVESDLSEMVRDMGEFTRRHPLASFGGSIAVGVVLTQIIQSRVAGSRNVGRSETRSRRTSKPSSAGVPIPRSKQRRAVKPDVANDQGEES